MMGERWTDNYLSTERKDQIEDFDADCRFDLATDRGNGWDGMICIGGGSFVVQNTICKLDR